MTDKPIGVGLIGCGNIGQIHAASLAHICEDGVPIRPVIAADPVEDNREAVASNWAFKWLVDDAHQVIVHPEVDVVLVCTPTATHRDLIFSVLEAGKHLYSEKPLAPTFKAVKEICRAVMASPIIAQVGFQMRWNAMHSRVKKLTQSGELGRPMSYLARDDECWPTTEHSSFASSWRSQRKFSGGGPLIEHSIHAVDLVSWMFGPPARVSAATRSMLGYDVEDAAALTLEHESGVIGNILTVFGGVEGREESRFEIFFERGIIEITWGVMVETEENSFRLEIAGEGPRNLDPAEILADHLAGLGITSKPYFWNELAHRSFFDSIRAGRPASPGFADALIAHAAIEAAYRSAQEKKVVAVKDLIGA
ncbi:MAG TPA: Gfo/Idh/MocA family oxidoreductase [bacterium]|nr:Gfo/Idh/MocA family oxidoreductase [bacterium]